MLTIEQRVELDAVMRKRHGNAALSRRARCVVLWADGERRVDIREKLACNDAFVTKWTTSFGAGVGRTCLVAPWAHAQGAHSQAGGSGA